MKDEQRSRLGAPRDDEGMFVAGQAFVITVGLPLTGTQRETNHHCNAVLRAIKRAGYRAAATSDESIASIHEEMQLVDGIVNPRSVLEDPPE